MDLIAKRKSIRSFEMKIALSLVAALLFTTHTRANDNLLMSFGLADLQVVSETEANQVSGKGWHGSRRNTADVRMMPAPGNIKDGFS